MPKLNFLRLFHITRIEDFKAKITRLKDYIWSFNIKKIYNQRLMKIHLDERGHWDNLRKYFQQSLGGTLHNSRKLKKKSCTKNQISCIHQKVQHNKIKRSIPDSSKYWYCFLFWSNCFVKKSFYV